MDGITLKNQLDGANAEIEKFISKNIDKNIFQRQGDIDNGIVVGFNQGFANLVTDYRGLSAADREEANKRLFGSKSSQIVDLYTTTVHLSVPDAETVFVSKCPNPSGNCYGYYVDANKDKRTCLEKHGASGVSNIVYWACETDSETCTRSKEHWLPCPGVCGKTFAPKKVSRGHGYYVYLPNFPHEVKCNEDVYDGFWKFWAKCYGTYGESSVWYTCERSSCPNSSLHNDGNSNSYYNEDGSGSDSGSGSTSENTPSPSPTYHACGVHLTSVPGNHSMQVSCSLHSGCSVMNFYVCDNHLPVYAPVDNTPNCSNCTDGCSSCQATCASGHTYDPNNNAQYNSHRTRTCGFSECRQTWQRCGSGAPICNKPYRKQNDMSCQETD